MTSTYQWSRYTDKLLPWWLKTSEGGLAKRAVDTMLGAFCERALDGAYAHGPGTCPEDALPFFGRDRGVRRGINEPAASWRVRQLRALDDRLTQGNAFALHDQLRAYLQADVPVRTVDRRGNWYTTGVGGVRSTSINSGNWDWDGAPAAQWSRFWVIIYSFSGIPFAQSTAGAWPGAGKTIGTSATPEQVPPSARSCVTGSQTARGANGLSWRSIRCRLTRRRPSLTARGCTSGNTPRAR